MSLPIDTNKVWFLVSTPPEPVIDWDTGEQALNGEGAGYFRVELVAMALGSRAEIIKVTVAGEPVGLSRRTPVIVTGLRALAWPDKAHRTAGIVYVADRIERDKAPGSWPS